MAEYFKKWHFESSWKWNYDDIFVVIPDPMFDENLIEVPLEEVYFDSKEEAVKCLYEHDVLLLKFDDNYDEYHFSYTPASVEYVEEFDYYRLVNGVHSHGIVDLHCSSFTFF